MREELQTNPKLSLADMFHVEMCKAIYKTFSMYYRYEQIKKCAEVVRSWILTVKGETLSEVFHR